MMIDRDSVNYGALYSFEPNFLMHVTEEEHPCKDEELEEGSYHLSRIDTMFTGLLFLLVFLLLVAVIFTLTASVSKELITSLSGTRLHLPQHSQQFIHQ